MRDLRLIVFGHPTHSCQSIELGPQPGENARTLLHQPCAMTVAIALRLCRFLHAVTDWFQQAIKVLGRIQQNFPDQRAI
jgi:hypothetical protein